MTITRREFLHRSFGAFGAAALAFERFGLLQAFAQSNDYKALVCIFLFGGNDSGNTVMPYDDYTSTLVHGRPPESHYRSRVYCRSVPLALAANLGFIPVSRVFMSSGVKEKWR